jgi:hypothetical protein
MRFALLMAAAAFVLLPAGCERPPIRPEIKAVQNVQIRNAIIRQRTVFPYHFVPHSAALNELGTHDLDVLAAYFLEHHGKLNVRRGDAVDALYEARVKAAMEALAEAGVRIDLVAITDELPSGDGMRSERVIIILENERPTPRSLGGTSVSFTVPSYQSDVQAME